MRTKSTSRSAFLIARVLLGSALYSVGLLPASPGLSQTVTGTIATKAPAQTPGMWTATGSMNSPRYDHIATLLPNGQVLVAGGGIFVSLSRAELYDPPTALWTVTGKMTTARELHTATLLRNGQVLVAGGFDSWDVLASAELYDPETGRWTATGSMATARWYYTATLLRNGKVLVAGGDFNDGPA